MRVLLVEDDDMVGTPLVQALERGGHAVDWIRDGAAAERAAASGEHDLWLLDIGLPDQSGFSVLDALRRAGGTMPVLIVSARASVDDRIHGLDLGADDYLTKPFDVGELMARMRALVRRRRADQDALLEAGDLTLDPASRELSHGSRRSVLPPREFALMRALMERPGTVMSRAQIEARLYGWGAEVDSNAVDVLIHSIRRRFHQGVVRNVRGAGWMVPKALG